VRQPPLARALVPELMGTLALVFAGAGGIRRIDVRHKMDGRRYVSGPIYVLFAFRACRYV
jgi:hypothetical protein